MARTRAPQPGEGAICSVLIKYLHPKPTINEHIPNYAANERLHDLVAVRKERTTRRGHTYDAVFFTSPTLNDAEVFCATRYVKVTTAGRNVWAATRVHPPSRDKIMLRT